MKILKGSFVFLLALILFICTTGCGNPPERGSSGIASDAAGSRWDNVTINGSNISEYTIVYDSKAGERIAKEIRERVKTYSAGKIDLPLKPFDRFFKNYGKLIRIGVCGKSGNPVFCDGDYALYADGGDLVLDATGTGLAETAARGAVLSLFEGIATDRTLRIEVPDEFVLTEGEEYNLTQVSAKRTAVLCDGASQYEFVYLNVDGREVRVYAVEIKSDSGCAFNAGTADDGAAAGGSVRTVPDMARTAAEKGKNVVCAVNSGFFDMRTGESLGVVVKDHRYLTYGRAGENHEWWGWTDGNSLIFGDYKDLKQYDGNWRNDIKEAASARRFLIRNGNAVPYNNEYDKGLVENRHPRSCILKRENDDVVIFVADGRYPGSAGLNFDEETEIAKRMGAFEALNLDGGGSSQLVTNAGGVLRLANKPEGAVSETDIRKVATGIIVTGP